MSMNEAEVLAAYARKGAYQKSLPQAAAEHTADVLRPVLYPAYQGYVVGAADPTQETLLMRDYGPCELSDGDVHNVIVSYDTPAPRDDYTIQIEGGPHPEDWAQNTQFIPDSSSAIGTIGSMGRRLPYVSDVRPQGAMGVDHYGYCDEVDPQTGQTKPAIGRRDKRVRKLNLRLLVGDGLEETVDSGAAGSDPSRGKLAGDHPDEWLRVKRVMVGTDYASGLEFDANGGLRAALDPDGGIELNGNLLRVNPASLSGAGLGPDDIIGHLGIDIDKTPPPAAAPGVALAAGGAVPTVAHRYALTYLTRSGRETTIGPWAAITPTDGQQTVTVTLAAVDTAALPFVTGRGIYRSDDGGAVWHHVADVAGTAAATYADGADDTTIDANPPPPSKNPMTVITKLALNSGLDNKAGLDQDSLALKWAGANTAIEVVDGVVTLIFDPAYFEVDALNQLTLLPDVLGGGGTPTMVRVALNRPDSFGPQMGGNGQPEGEATVNWDDLQVDTTGGLMYHAATPDRLIAPTAGLYIVSAQLSAAYSGDTSNTAATPAAMKISLSITSTHGYGWDEGGAIEYFPPAPTTSIIVVGTGAIPIQMGAGDYVQVLSGTSFSDTENPVSWFMSGRTPCVFSLIKVEDGGGSGGGGGGMTNPMMAQNQMIVAGSGGTPTALAAPTGTTDLIASWDGATIAWRAAGSIPGLVGPQGPQGPAGAPGGVGTFNGDAGTVSLAGAFPVTVTGSGGTYTVGLDSSWHPWVGGGGAVTSVNGATGDVLLAGADGLSWTGLTVHNAYPGYHGGPFHVYDDATLGPATLQVDGDTSVVDGSLSLLPAGRPTDVPSVNTATGTALGIGRYWWGFTETQGGVEGPLSVTAYADVTANNQSGVITLPAAAAAVTARTLYRTPVGGGRFGQVGSLGLGIISYHDTLIDASLGVPPPGGPSITQRDAEMAGGSDTVPFTNLQWDVDGVSGYVPVFRHGFAGFETLSPFSLVGTMDTPTTTPVWFSFAANNQLYYFQAYPSATGSAAIGEGVPGEIVPG